ncbi:MAG: CAI-1 autoinducer sensor kinase/phosphatase CqsS [Bacteroidetes bacterium ADurb.Bin408]|nr:MAG: CAI-1 autoinducer sensor kinase/phosphatase CqsS [Bacteroidetes bacterium ADurb.Bin408]
MTATLYKHDVTALLYTEYYVTDTAQIGYYRPNNLTGIKHILSNKPLVKYLDERLTQRGCLKMTASHIDFILMDIKMPLMDGLEATRLIRDMNPDIIIIALSAYVYTEQGQNLFSAGFNYFITKPFDADALINVLKKI